MDTRAQVVADLYAALKARDWDAMAQLFAADAELGISGRSPVAGTYRSPPEAVGAFRRLVEETDDTFGPVREDTWDICTSDHHVILIEWLQATRNRRTARFHIHLVCALQEGKILRAFASFDSQYAFDELWS